MTSLSPGESRLGAYLRDRRGRLDPASFGLPPARRRTPGLRREEVAQRADISPTWYTWLEQGRGGAPSAEVLDRIARALMLTDAEREHLFLLGLGRPPEVRYTGEGGVTPRLQRLLDALEVAPAMIKTPTWDVLAWNRAATAVHGDYSALPPHERNTLRLMFCDPRMRAAQDDWEGVARVVVGAFRADVIRAGAEAKVAALVEELRQRSPEFEALWRDNDVRGHASGVKQLRHPVMGLLSFDFSILMVDGRPDLGMVVHNPATEEDVAKIRAFLKRRDEGAPAIVAEGLSD